MDTPLVETRGSLTASCALKDLADGAQAVGRAVSTRTSLPILNHILIQSEEDRLRLSATDMELGISLTIPAKVAEPGGLTAPSRLLNDLLSTLPDAEVTLNVDRSHAMRVTCDKSDFKLLGLPHEDYPRLPEVKDEHAFSVAQNTLRDMIRQTIFAVSPDEARAILTGVLVCFEESTLKLVATDTHRLALRTAPIIEPRGGASAIVPARAMNELLRMLTDEPGFVTVRMSENQAMFQTPGGVTLVSRLIDGQYPNYSRVIPTACQHRLTLQTQSLLQAVRSAAVVARSAANRVQIKTDGDRLQVTAESSIDGNAYEEVEIAYEGEGVEMAFNAKYLLDVLQVVGAEGVYLDVTDPLKPAVMRPVADSADEEYLCLLMPMQLV
jgi:DNA polymerase-3 subunit beta